MKRAKPFATEADLCARFIAAIGEEWVSYNEHAGWDMLVVRKADGFQIGIQAKLRLNTDVVSQAIEEYGAFAADRAGPDCRAVLVPSDQMGGFDRICEYIGITIIRVRSEEEMKPENRSYYRYNYRKPFEPQLPEHGGQPGTNYRNWYEWAPGKRLSIEPATANRRRRPGHKPADHAWKIDAIKIAIILEKRGYLTRSDFKHIGIDHRRWLPSGNRWLKLDGSRYLEAPGFPNFRAQHPRVYEEIAADYDAWKPSEPVLAPVPVKQESLL